MEHNNGWGYGYGARGYSQGGGGEGDGRWANNWNRQQQQQHHHGADRWNRQQPQQQPYYQQQQQHQQQHAQRWVPHGYLNSDWQRGDDQFDERGWPVRRRHDVWPRQTGGGPGPQQEGSEAAPSARDRVAATSTSSSSDRRNPDGSTFVPPSPRESYLAFAEQEPQLLPVTPSDPSTQPWPPRKLLILDLNGTLCFRKRSRANSGSADPTPRPYLRNFFQYCLGHGAVDVPSSLAPQQSRPWVDNQRPPAPPHGTQFWTDRMVREHHEGRPRTLDPQARYELLVWSSAQDHNVNLMVQSLMGTKFDLRPPGLVRMRGSKKQTQRRNSREMSVSERSVSPLSARSASPPDGDDDAAPPNSLVIPRTGLPHPASFLRVWGRSTLVISRHRSLKVPSVKDLDIVWVPLNTSSETDLDADRREERRQRGAVAEPALPHTPDPALWGPHNTFLLDDSTDKTSMQPYNHLWVPEFSDARAKQAEQFTRDVRDAIEELGEEDEGDAEDTSAPRVVPLNPHLRKGLEELDDVLLQTIGVLETARQQANVAAWVHSGALGRFGPPPPPPDGESGPRDGIWEPEDWAREGRRALRRLGIEPSPI